MPRSCSYIIIFLSTLLSTKWRINIAYNKQGGINVRKWVVLISVMMSVLLITACTVGKGDDKVLYINNGDEPTSLNPPAGFDAVSWNALNNLLEGLTRLNADHVPEAAIAEEWDLSDDEMTYTFHIRDHANWSNGDPVTADDFVYAWLQLLNPDAASPAAFLGYVIEGAEAYHTGGGSEEDVAIKAVDEKTLEVKLNAPTGYFLHLITNPGFFPVNKKVAEEDPDWHTEAETYVSNGPFILESWSHNEEMVMVKNDEYWDKDTVKLTEVHWAMVEDANTSYQMFESDELDMAGIPSELSDQLIDGDDVVIADQAGLDFYRFNVTMEPFQNKKIRQAFALAVNQEDIVEYVTRGKEEPAKGFVSYGFEDKDGNDFRDVNGELVVFNPEEAKRLLEEGMKEEGYDELPEVVISFNTSEAHKAKAEALQDMFSENLGVDVTLENTEWQVFLEDQNNLNLQLSRSSFLFDYGDPINFLESFITGSSMNRTGFSNEEYDKLIADAKVAPEDERWELMYEAEKLLADEMIIFPMHFYNHVHIYKEGITDVIRHPVGYLELKWTDKE